MEAEFLRYLVRSEGRVVSRKSILEDVWGLHEDTDTRAIDNFVVRLRRYIEEDPSSPKHLQTVRGVGIGLWPSRCSYGHSYRSASIGSSLAARTAGNMPLATPTKPRIVVAMRTVFGETSSRISPASALCSHGAVQGEASHGKRNCVRQKNPKNSPAAVITKASARN